MTRASSGLRAAARSEAGFTIVEVLVSLVIGLIVLSGALTVLDTSARLTVRVNRRVDAVARGRTALDRMERDLRSQVCVGTIAGGVTTTEDSLRGGSAASVDFYADLGDGTAAQPPTRRTLTFDPTARTIVEAIYTPTGTAGAYVYPTTPQKTRTLLTDVTQDGTTPVFRFYGFDTATPPTPSTPLTSSPLSATDLTKVVRVAVAFKVLRAGATTSNGTETTLQDDIFRRSVDPDLTNPTPECMA